MPVLADTIKKNGTGIFTMLVFSRVTSQATITGVESAFRFPKLTDANGAFTQTLAPGSHAMEWRLDPAGKSAVGRGPFSRIEFTMPSDGGPYALWQLVGIEEQAFEVDLALAGWTALKAVTLHPDRRVMFLSYLDSEGDGQGGRYEYDAGSMSDEFKPDIAKPNDVDSEDPGRWLKTPYP